MGKLARIAVALLFSVLAIGCAGPGAFVWVDDLPPEGPRGSNEYRIHAGDVVSIHVFQQDAMSVAKARVREDGKIAFPILGDIVLAGKRPSDVKGELETKLKDYVLQPHVTVTIDEAQPIQITVLGEVARPANITLPPSSGVAQALAFVGGPTDYADRDRVFVVRGNKRIRFTYESIIRGEGRAGNFTLQSGDLVVLE